MLPKRAISVPELGYYFPHIRSTRIFDEYLMSMILEED
jgi:hypothetical protein